MDPMFDLTPEQLEAERVAAREAVIAAALTLSGTRVVLAGLGEADQSPYPPDQPDVDAAMLDAAIGTYVEAVQAVLDAP